MKIQIFFGILILALVTGCATLPTREALPTYNINGTNYLSLVSLCDLRGIKWEYDTFAKRVTLSRDNHEINLMVGEKLITVDGQTEHLRHPVDIYQGAIVVPYRFKEQIIESLFREPARRVSAGIKIKKVVVDAGHGGTDPGAIGKTGISEKIITLDIARRIDTLLMSEGVEVVMTRSTDKFIPLSRRVEIANHAQADLFLSIHANANRLKTLNGFEVYYLSSDIDDAARALAAAKDYTLDLDNASFASNSLYLKATLWDMLHTYNRAEAVELAQSICKAINRDLETKILGIKGARFYVLKGVRIPAVLIEVGFLSNREEEVRLKNNFYRQKIAEAVVEGVRDYASDLTLALGE